VHQKHNVLVAPRDLRIEDGHLVIYKENQWVCDWGIAVDSLGADDPPVHVSYVDAAGKVCWGDEFSSVTEFLCAQGAWQAIEGGLPFVGLVTDVEIAGLESTSATSMGKRVRSTARQIGREFVATKGMTAWVIQGCVLAMASDSHFGLASRDEARFMDVCGQLGVRMDDWDYASLRDD
jgi:hypothetical protein